MTTRTEKIAPPDPPALSHSAPHYPVPDRLLHEATTVSYTAIILENQFLEVTVLPELGGRVYRARQKADDRDLFLFNPAIIPARLHGYGAGFVGGLEFGFPDAPGLLAFASLTWRIVETIENAEPSVTLWVGGHGLDPDHQWAAGIRLREESRALEIEIRLTNAGDRPWDCGFVSTAYLNGSESLRLWPVPDPAIDDVVRSLRNNPDGDEFDPRRVVEFQTGAGEAGLYDVPASTGLLHLMAPGSIIEREARFWNEPGSLKLWGELTGVGSTGFCELRSVLRRTRDGGRRTEEVAPGHQVRWSEEWLAITGIAAGETGTGETAAGQPASRETATGETVTDESGSRRILTSSAVTDEIRFIEPSPDAGANLQALSLHSLPDPPFPAPGARRPVADAARSDPVADAARSVPPRPVPGPPRPEPPSSVLRPSSRVDDARRELTLALRNGPTPESVELMRALVDFSPLDPVVRWLERRNGPWEWKMARLEPASPAIDWSQLYPGHNGSDSPPAALDPQPVWLLNVGRIFDSLGMDEADEALEEAITTGIPAAGYRLGARAARAGNMERARGWFDRAASLPLDTFTLLRAGDEACLELALERPAWTTLYYLGVGRLLEARTGEARDLLERALEMSPPGEENPWLLRALAACLWPHQGLDSTPTSDDIARAELLLDRAVERAPHDVSLLLARDFLAGCTNEPSTARLARLQRAPADVRMAGDIALRTAYLLVETRSYDDAIRLLNAATIDPRPGQSGGWQPYSTAHLSRALGRMAAQEFDGALDDLEAAMEYPVHVGDAVPLRPPHTELRWWAGEACHQLGRGFQARAYWQSAAADRHPPDRLEAPLRALAIRRLGGAAQSQALLEETLMATEPASTPIRESDLTAFIVAQSADDSSPDLITDPGARLARAIALAAVGDRAGAMEILDALRSGLPSYAPAARYRPLIEAGLIDAG